MITDLKQDPADLTKTTLTLTAESIEDNDVLALLTARFEIAKGGN